MSNLNPKQFDPQFGDGLYHGTSRVIQGDHILPAYRTEHKTTNYSQSSPHLAHATEDENTAWEMPLSASNRPGTARMAGRTRVHVLEPNKEMEVGKYHPDHEDFAGENLAEWVAPEFKVNKTLDIRAGQQGTFPSLNWNQFAKQGAMTPFSDNFNHPDDDEIEHGHPGSSLNQHYLRHVLGRGGLEDLEREKQTPRASDPEQGRLF